MPLRTFYIIIKSDYVDNKGYLNLFPWMKIHGSIEAYSYKVARERNYVCFHEWKFMALLKPQHYTSTSLTADLFPWMKIHGSIEAFKFSAELGFLMQFPWMKIHGSIEAYAGVSSQPHPGGFHEWKFMALLKLMQEDRWGGILSCFHEWKFMALLKHPGAADRAIIADQVSMNENSWLYWSEEQTVNDGRNKSIGFHEWKFMALLKRDHIWCRSWWEWRWFPWMKIHGSIEAEFQWFIHNRHGRRFPWMKIHGSIEA